MRIRPRHLIASVVAAVAAITATPMVASANSQYGCSTLAGHLHASATLINYGSSRGTAVYASATGTYKEVITFGPDITWRFARMTLTPGSTKRSNPSQWGSSTSPLNFSTKYLKVTWYGTQLGVTTDSTHSCTVRVGA